MSTRQHAGLALNFARTQLNWICGQSGTKVQHHVARGPNSQITCNKLREHVPSRHLCCQNATLLKSYYSGISLTLIHWLTVWNQIKTVGCLMCLIDWVNWMCQNAFNQWKISTSDLDWWSPENNFDSWQVVRDYTVARVRLNQWMAN